MVIFFGECVVRTVRIAADRDPWCNMSFRKLDECFSFDILHHLHLDILWDSLLVERNLNQQRRLCRAAATFASFRWRSETHVIKLDQTCQLVLDIAVSIALRILWSNNQAVG